MDNLNNVRYNDSYVSRMPTPPRIIVPPPSLSDFSNTNTILPVSQAGAASGFTQWSYEDRRSAQSILPYLFLGPTSAGKDQKFMRDKGITMILAIRHSRPDDARTKVTPTAIRMAAENGLATEVLDVCDNQSFIAAVPKAIKSINAHIQQQRSLTGHAGKTLVCCDSGNDRSAALVVAYLMEALNVDLIPAIQHVQGSRFCICIDDDMRQTLQAFEDLTKARRDCNGGSLPTDSSEANHVNGSLRPDPQRTSSKRRITDDEEGSRMDVDEGLNVTDHSDGVVRSFAPFGS